MALVASQLQQPHAGMPQNPPLCRGQEGIEEPARNNVLEEGQASSLEVAWAFCLLPTALPHLASVGSDFGS